MSGYIFSFIKNKSGFKLEEKLPIPSACNRRSAWSYSYDLKLNRMCEALEKTKKHVSSESEVEDKLSSRDNSVRDLDNDFIFQGSKEFHEHGVTESLRRSLTEAVNYDSLENTHEHQISKAANNLDSPTMNKMEQCLSKINSLRLSDVQKQQSWLARIIRPFPKEMDDADERKRRNKEKIGYQIHQSIINYLEQFVQKTALPSLQKLEQLQMEYYTEKTKWKKQIEFLKQRNSLLKSELQYVRRAYKNADEELTNLKTFAKQNQYVVGRNFDMDLDPQMFSLESKKPDLSWHKDTVEKELMDVKLASYNRKLNHHKLERPILINENKTSEKRFLKIRKTLNKAGPLSFKPTFIKKPFLSRKILQDSKIKLVPNGYKKLKLGNTDFQKKRDIGARSRHEDFNFSLIERLEWVRPLMIKFPQEQHPFDKTVNFMSNEISCTETWASFLKEQKSGKGRPIFGEDRKNIQISQKTSGDLWKVSQLQRSSLHLKENLSPTADFPNSDALKVDNSWKRRKPDNPINTINGRVLKVDKEKMFFNFQKINQTRTVRCSQRYKEYQASSERLDKGLTGVTIRSNWL